MKNKLILFALVILVSISGYQQYTINDLNNRLLETQQNQEIVNRSLQTKHPKIAFIDIESTLESYKDIDPEGEQVFGLLDKAVETYNNHDYIVLDRDLLIGKPKWAKTISLEITEE